MQGLLGFPHPVNEKAARVVAGVVALVGASILTTHWRFLLVPLAYGFWARVLTGPRLSPLGRLAQQHVAPRLGPPRYVAGPPKRFAQGMGAAMTTAALAVWLLGAPGAADVLVGALVVAAALESVLALCLGCKIFALLIRAGVVPDDVCAECADIWSRPRPGRTGA